MANRKNQWDHFTKLVRSFRRSCDGIVPVAAIMLPAKDGEGGTYISPDGPVQVLWPAEIPVSWRDHILKQLGEQAGCNYEAHSAKTTDEEDDDA